MATIFYKIWPSSCSPPIAFHGPATLVLTRYILSLLWPLLTLFPLPGTMLYSHFWSQLNNWTLLWPSVQVDAPGKTFSLHPINNLCNEMFYHELDGIGQDINFSIYPCVVWFVAVNMNYISHFKKLFKSMKNSIITVVWYLSPSLEYKFQEGHILTLSCSALWLQNLAVLWTQEALHLLSECSWQRRTESENGLRS